MSTEEAPLAREASRYERASGRTSGSPPESLTPPLRSRTTTASAFGPSRHHIQTVLPSGILKALTGLKSSERAAVSTLLRVMFGCLTGDGSPITRALTRLGETSSCRYAATVSPSGYGRR